MLLHTSNVFDGLYREKSANLVVPQQAMHTERLNEAIRNFNTSLDQLTIQLNDVALFDIKLKEEAVERTKQRQREAELAEKQKNAPQEQQQQQSQQSQQSQAQPEAQLIQNDDDDDGFGQETNTILDDLNDFLSNVPETDSIPMEGDLNDNIQQLLMESGGGDYGDDGINMNDFGLGDNNEFGGDFGGSMSQNNGNNINGQSNQADGVQGIDDSIFNEIDSMLNL